ncbi:glycosyltransferase family 39 protein [candidate division KSB1 bacterium]|nr:glycosyltransferase family 39 protein [candidate division KSB1 bacterium]
MIRQKSDRSIVAIIFIMAVAKLAIHLYTNLFAGYGIFRDEFYYIACSNHPAFGYVDQPPLSIFLLALNRLVFGDSLFALRLLPALVAACTVGITGLITKRLHGGPWAVFLACLALVVAPVHLAMCSIYSMNCFDWLFWSLAAYIFVCLLQKNKPIHWILLGVVLGLGLLNKVGVLWLGFGLAASIILSPLRKNLRTPWPWLAAGIAFILFAPFIIWNLTHDLAHLEFMHNATQYKYNGLTPVEFLSAQILLIMPMGLLLALVGLGYFFIHKSGRKYMSLAVIFVSTLIILVVNWHSKSEYLGPAYPALFTGGAVLLEIWFKKRSLVWLKYVFPAVLLVIGVLVAPFAIAVLPVEDFISYSQKIGIAPENTESHDLSQLPQFYADMHGWENMAATVSRVYTSLPDSVKSTTAVYAHNYGEAGAMDYFRCLYPLPPVLSPHNNYWLWWDNDLELTTLIIIGGNVPDHKSSLRNVERVDVIKSDYAIPYENNLPVFVASGFLRSLRDIWLSDKIFI